MGRLMNTVHRSNEQEAIRYNIGPFDIPGVVENGVTYTNHHYTISFGPRCGTSAACLSHDQNDKLVPRYREAFVTSLGRATPAYFCFKGSIVDTIYNLANEDKAACFHVIHGLLRTHEESFYEGHHEGQTAILVAAAEKRLKTRKLPGGNSVRVSVRHPTIKDYDTIKRTIAMPEGADTSEHANHVR